jgi:phage-related baseplate assembly protein
MTIDLTQLPPPDLVEPLDFEQILADLRADLAVRLPEFTAGDLESDPIVKLLEAFGYREMLLRQRINEAGRATLLAFATGADLDHLAALLGVVRGEAETDTRLRARTQLSLEGFSTAGPIGAYRYHALAASPLVKDVGVFSPEPGVVRVAVLSDVGDGTASGDLLGLVVAALSDEDVRPLTDQLQVISADIVPYTVNAGLVIADGPDAALVLAQAQAQAQTYVAQRHRVGRRVAVSGLLAALHAAGVERVELSSPLADVVPSSQSAAFCTALSVAVLA